MIRPTSVYLVAAVVYGLCLLGFGVWFRRAEGAARRYCGLAMLFVGVGGLSHLLSGFGVGLLQIPGGVVDLPSLSEDLVTYPGLFVLVGLLAGASRRLLGLLAGTMVAIRLVFELPNSGLATGSGALLSAAAVVVGYLAIVYLFVRPVWASAQHVSARQRLLHWKCRNLVLFLFGVLLVYAILAVTGVFDPFVLAVVNSHIDLLIRVGTAGLIFANMDELRETATGPNTSTKRRSPVEAAES